MISPHTESTGSLARKPKAKQKLRTAENLIQEEIKRRLNSGNACYHSDQNLLFSRPLSENAKIRIYKTIIVPVVLYVCDIWSLTLREAHTVD
jgi:hypothetical protein